MKWTRPIANAPDSRWGRAVLWVGLCVALSTAFAVGCSPQRNYRVLSFFFDGVPDPNAPKRPQGAGESESAPQAGGPVVTVIEHKPYRDGKCDACHTGADANRFESFQKVGNDVCLRCHANKLTQYPVMHGPVVSVECLICHTPHESAVPGLLNVAPPQVCTQCHERDLLSANPPEHQAANSQCLKCHVAHGGPKHGFLRANVLPSTRPTGAPATPAAPTTPAPQRTPAPPISIGGRS